MTGIDLGGKIWATSVDMRGLTVQNGKVYSVVRSEAEGDLTMNALLVFGNATAKAMNKSGCAGGR